MTEAATQTPDVRYTRQAVTQKTIWLDEKLFSLRVTRDPAFRFEPGQFARIGLALDPTAPDTPSEWRAYSMVSTPDESELEFFSVVVPSGKFSPPLAGLVAGNALFIDKTAFGFLTLERFVDGRDLWLISTGTGLSAYLSMLRYPATWQRFRRLIVIHGVRRAPELAYRQELLDMARTFGQASAGQLIYVPITSQEPLDPDLAPGLRCDLTSASRITHLLSSGELELRAGATLDPDHARVMLCGNPAMVTEMRALLGARGFAPGRRGIPGNLAVENYW